MKTTRIVLSVALSLLIAAPGVCSIPQSQSVGPAVYEHIDSGDGPPMNWNEIEISHPEGGGA